MKRPVVSAALRPYQSEETPITEIVGLPVQLAQHILICPHGKTFRTEENRVLCRLVQEETTMGAALKGKLRALQYGH
jgi:hypothetical protein